MTQEEKQLLLKDLCGRLPYKPKCLVLRGQFDPDEATVRGYDGRVSVFLKGDFDEIEPEKVRLYLRPMSSMTEEEDKEWRYYKNKIAESCDELLEERIADCHNFFNSHHFDYRGLIEKGLAIEVTEDNNPYK